MTFLKYWKSNLAPLPAIYQMARRSGGCSVCEALREVAQDIAHSYRVFCSRNRHNW